MISPKEATQIFSSYGAVLSPLQLELVREYTQLLLKWNRKINLTRIVEEHAIYTQHFGESFFLDRFLTTACRTMLDVGSGAGFPGLALKILQPGVGLTLLEPSAKKSTFLREVVEALGFRGTSHVLTLRLEDFRDQAEPFDALTLRGVRLTEALAVHFDRLLRSGGRLLYLTGLSQARELEHRGMGPHWKMAEEPVPNSPRVLLVGEKCST